MELHAYTRTISDLFSVKKKYVVPRFQREYSWTTEKVSELWDDIISNISILSFIEKIEIYKQSNFILTQEFAQNDYQKWKKEEIEDRTASLAEYCYDSMWSTNE